MQQDQHSEEHSSSVKQNPENGATEDEEAGLIDDEMPTSSAILGMRLDQGFKGSDGDDQSCSVMGLSALGLQSHRTSQDNNLPPELVVEIDASEAEVVDGELSET